MGQRQEVVHMLELCTRKDKDGIPIASAEMLD